MLAYSRPPALRALSRRRSAATIHFVVNHPPRRTTAPPAAAAAASGRGSSSDAEQYTRLSPVEHVLLRPGMYVGSVAAQLEWQWVYEAASGRMVYREVRYVPALYKIFDELLVNALDNTQRDAEGTTAIELRVDAASGELSVRNNGRGIPVMLDEAEGMYLPELVMGHLFSGSNFEDAAKQTVGGRHGFGAKLANIFSSEFTVATADTARGLLYEQTWRRNMGERGEPRISKLRRGQRDFTQATLVPDAS